MSHQRPLATAHWANQFRFDTGVATGRYLQALAVLSISSMCVDYLMFELERLDLNAFLMLWGGHALKKHSGAARRWVIGISSLMVVVAIGTVGTALVRGTDGMVIHIGRPIQNPSVAEVAGLASVLAALAAVPLVLLLSRQAREEFAPWRRVVDL